MLLRILFFVTVCFATELQTERYFNLIRNFFHTAMYADTTHCISGRTRLFTFLTHTNMFYFDTLYLVRHDLITFNKISPYRYYVLQNVFNCLCRNTSQEHYIVAPQLHGNSFGFDELTYCNPDQYIVNIDIYEYQAKVIYSMPRSIYLSNPKEPSNIECFDKRGHATNQYPHQTACMFVATAFFENDNMTTKLFSGPLFTRGLYYQHLDLNQLLNWNENQTFLHRAAFAFITTAVTRNYWGSKVVIPGYPKVTYTGCQGHHFWNNGKAFFSVICLCEHGDDETCSKIKAVLRSKEEKFICAFNGKGSPELFLKAQCAFKIHVDNSVTYYRTASETKCSHLKRTFFNNNVCQLFENYTTLTQPVFTITYCCKHNFCNFKTLESDRNSIKAFNVTCKYSRRYAAKRSRSCSFIMISDESKVLLMLPNYYQDIRKHILEYKNQDVIAEFQTHNKNITVGTYGILSITKEEKTNCSVKLKSDRLYTFVQIGCATDYCDEDLLHYVNTPNFHSIFNNTRIGLHSCDVGVYYIKHPIPKESKFNKKHYIGCVLNITVDYEIGNITATVNGTNLIADMLKPERCDLKKMNGTEESHICWFYGKMINVTELIENLMIKKKEAYLQPRQETDTYADLCPLAGFRRQKSNCIPGHHGCFIVSKTIHVTDNDEKNEDTNKVYESCIGELESRVYQNIAINEIVDALVCNADEIQDECFYVNKGSMYSIACCCKTQFLDLHAHKLHSGKKVHRCSMPVKEKFDSTRKISLKTVGNFADQ